MQKFSHFDPDLEEVFYKACDLKVSTLTLFESYDILTDNNNSDELFYILKEVEIIKALIAKMQAKRDNPEYWSEPK
jgi:hypothetical protein